MNAIIIDLGHPVDQFVYQPNCMLQNCYDCTAYGMWNLDFFKYILPPFYLSSHLKQAHIALFGCIVVVFPLCLMIITPVCVELHGHNCWSIMWLWRPLHKIFVKLRKEWDVKCDMIDTFATFLLLSCSKVMYQSVLLICCPSVRKASSKTGGVSISYVGGNDLTSPCGGTNHLSFAIPASFVGCLVSITNSLSFQMLQRFLGFFSKCGFLNSMSVTIFVEKFHKKM